MPRTRPSWRSYVSLILAAAVSMACAFSTKLWKSEGPQEAFTVATLFLMTVAGFGGAFLLPVYLTCTALFHSLRVATKREGLVFLFLGYVSLIMSFASLYYVISWQADLEDAENQYVYYADLRAKWPACGDPPAFRTSSYRAFRGVEEKLWTGVEEASRPHYYPKDRDATVSSIFEHVRWVKDQPSFVVRWSGFPTQLRVFADCLHFSIVTMSTVGYGDIAPRSRLAKLTTDLQILSGTVLFLFALGYVLGKAETRGGGDA